MMYVIGVVIAILAFVAMYSAAISKTKWFMILNYALLSVVVSVLVTANLF